MKSTEVEGPVGPVHDSKSDSSLKPQEFPGEGAKAVTKHLQETRRGRGGAVVKLIPTGRLEGVPLCPSHLLHPLIEQDSVSEGWKFKRVCVCRKLHVLLVFI